MPQVFGDELRQFEILVEKYNQCFYSKDLLALKDMYVSDGGICYWDNHPACDSQTLQDHENKVGAFFEQGTIEELSTDNLMAFKSGKGACVVVTFRYRNKPIPRVRTTLYLEREDGLWKIRHMHHSFDPNEQLIGIQ